MPSSNFGHTELPSERASDLRRAVRLEWITVGLLASGIVLVYLVMGNSQAMRAAWLEDLLSLIPPISFLVSVHFAAKRPSKEHPYGYHRSIAGGHLVAAAALLAMGSFLFYESLMGLIALEHPPIGSVRLFGHTFWAGWLMVAAMLYTLIFPVILGRLKMPLANRLHDRVLYADADMNKADWMTAAAAIVGVVGIGFGWWWLDSTAALVISASILRDGFTNLRTAGAALMDATARTTDGSQDHPLLGQIDTYLSSRPWIAEHGVRLRDEGHVFHVEVFVVPADLSVPHLQRLEQAKDDLLALDWKVNDVVMVPVRTIPAEQVPDASG